MPSAKPTTKAKTKTTGSKPAANGAAKLTALPALAVKLLLAIYARRTGEVWSRNMEMSQDDGKGGTWTVAEKGGCVRLTYRPDVSKAGSFKAKCDPIEKAIRLHERDIVALAGNIRQQVEASKQHAQTKAKRLTAEALDRAVSKARSSAKGLKSGDVHKIKVDEVKVDRIPGQRESNLGVQLTAAESDLTRAKKDLKAVRPAPLVKDRTHEFPMDGDGMEFLVATK